MRINNLIMFADNRGMRGVKKQLEDNGKRMII